MEWYEHLNQLMRVHSGDAGKCKEYRVDLLLTLLCKH